MLEIVSKLREALGGFWLTLDSEEKRLVVILGAYTLASLLAVASQNAANRRSALIREELNDLLAERERRYAVPFS